MINRDTGDILPCLYFITRFPTPVFCIPAGRLCRRAARMYRRAAQPQRRTAGMKKTISFIKKCVVHNHKWLCPRNIYHHIKYYDRLYTNLPPSRLCPLSTSSIVIRFFPASCSDFTSTHPSAAAMRRYVLPSVLTLPAGIS